MFIFGGNTGETASSIKRKRDLAQGILSRAPAPRDLGSGLHSFGSQIAAALIARQANKAQEKKEAEAGKVFDAVLKRQLGGAAPAVPQDAPPAPMEDPAPPVDPMSAGIRETAKALGIDPVDLGTVISYETGGTFDPKQPGPTTQWGRHRGLIQFGEPQAKQYGVNWEDPLGSQLGAEGAIAKYLRAAGVQPGMGLDQIYSAVNAGSVGRMNATDAHNGGAPGTVADKVKTMGPHREKALALLGSEPLAAPSAVPDAPARQEPLGIDPELMSLLGSDFTTPGQKMVLQALLQQRMKALEPAMSPVEAERLRMEQERLRMARENAEREQRNADRRFNFTVDQANRPKPGFRAATPEEAQRFGVDAGQIGPDGRFYPVEPKAPLVTIDNGLDQDEFAKVAGKRTAERFGTWAEGGDTARQMLGNINALESLLAQSGTGTAVRYGEWARENLGINIAGNSAAEAASALIERMTPGLRPPGSGPMSDADIRMFRNSLPGLANTPEGNALIIAGMRGIAEYNLAVGAIADRALMGDITPKQARDEMNGLGNPLSDFEKQRDAIMKGEAPARAPAYTPAPPPEGVSQEEWDAMVEEEYRKLRASE